MPDDAAPAAAPQPPTAFDGRIALRRLRIAFALLLVATALMFVASRVMHVAAIDRGAGMIEYRIARPVQAIGVCCLALLGAAAVFAVRSRVPFPGYVLAAGASLLFLVNLLLNGQTLADRVVLEPDRFVVPPSGFVWKRPREIRLGELSSIWIRTDAPDRRTVVFVPHEGAPTEVPLGTLLTAALPELARRAAERGVEVIDDTE